MDNQDLLAFSRFPALAKLARDDPQAFEALRGELIEDFIMRAPESIQFRLRRIQFRLDGIHRLSRSPLGALIKIQALMWDSFLSLDRALQSFRRFGKNGLRERPGPSSSEYGGHQGGRVIEFRPRRVREP